MQPEDRQPFADLLGQVMAYYGRDASEFLLDVFWTGLKMHEFEDVSRALSLHARDPDHGQFAPKVADITRLLEGSTASQGMQAWSKVEAAVKSVGAYKTVVFDDPLIHVVLVEMGGWTELCRSRVDELPFKARDFERRYSAYRLRREMPAFLPRLAGEHEANNRLNGCAHEVTPVLIGDPARAALVLEKGKAGSTVRITQASKAVENVLPRLSASRGAA